MNSGMLIPVIVFAWAVFLIPGLIRRRTERGAGDSIADFRNRMNRLNERPGGRSRGFGNVTVRQGSASRSLAQSRARRSKRRRLEVFTALLALAIGSAGVALLGGTQLFWTFHVAVDAVLAGYVLLLLRWKQQAAPSRVVAPVRTSASYVVGRELAYAPVSAD